MTRACFVVTLSVLIAHLYGFATIINIPDDYATIQRGIDAGTYADTVLVQPGVYIENIEFDSQTRVLASLYILTSDSMYIDSTIIDGNGSGSVITIENSIGSAGMIIGFTIRNGSNWSGGGISCSAACDPIIANNKIINNNASSNGAGIYISEYCDPVIQSNYIANNETNGSNGWGAGIFFIFNSHPQIINNVITDNTSSNFAGGIACYSEGDRAIVQNNVISNNESQYKAGGIVVWSNSNISILDNIIENNYAESYGGGILVHEANPVISGNLIKNNTVELYNGGGIYCDIGTEPLILNNIITGNQTLGPYGNGGGIYCFLSSPIIERNLIKSNIVHGFNGYGGGINCEGSYATITNNTLYGNSVPNEGFGGGIYCGNYSSPMVVNTIAWEDTAEFGEEIYLEPSASINISYSDIQLGWDGEGNLDIDPLFNEPEVGDFHLQFNSPCIDAGNPTEPNDPDSTRCDIGAYYYDQLVSVNELINIPADYSLFQNFPNPFNNSTNIKFELAERSQVTIDIYDILGRHVASVNDAFLSAGYHQAVWNAENFSSGVYFYKLAAGQYIETKSMTLIK